MFDARSLLEQMVNGANRGTTPGQSAGGASLNDLLGSILGGRETGGREAGAGPASGGGQSGGLSDILGQLQQSLGGGQPAAHMRPAASAGADSGGLSDILGRLQQGLGGQSGGGGIADILGQVLGQATQGVREGAGRVGEATGAQDAFNRTTGQSPDELIAKIKDLIANNQLGAGAALGGLGGLVLGTRTGRDLAVGAAKVGALALIGGLAYKAYQNYQAGRPLITGPHPAEAAPAGTGFEPQALTNQSATTYIRAMIAAANADGRIDSGEREKIFGALKQGGIEAEAEAFIQSELSRPATIEELADGVTSQEEAAQIYTAARIAIDPDTTGENLFLSALANRLGIDPKLAAFIDHEARTTSA